MDGIYISYIIYLIVAWYLSGWVIAFVAYSNKNISEKD